MSNKLMIILIGVLCLLVLVMGGGMFLIYTKLAVVSPPPPAAEADANEEKAKADKNAEKPKSEQPGKMVSLETFIVNLADPGGNRYLRVTMDLEVAGGKPADDEMAKRIPQLRDAVLMILATKRFADISTTEGKIAMREELTAIVNDLMVTANVTRIYFKEFVIQ